MYRFAKFIIAYIASPKVRVWHKNGGDVVLVKPSPTVKQVEHAHISKSISKADIAHLAVVLDSRGRDGVTPSIEKKAKPNGQN